MQEFKHQRCFANATLAVNEASAGIWIVKPLSKCFQMLFPT